MSILYWGHGSEGFKTVFESSCEHADTAGKLHTGTNSEGLWGALATQRADLRLVVLAPASAKELQDLLPLNALLSGIPVILLLQSDDNDTLDLAHRFHPRFVSSARGALGDAAAVAANIIKNGRGVQ